MRKSAHEGVRSVADEPERGKMVDKMRANTAKQERPTRARPLKRTRKKVDKPGRKKT